MSGARNQSLLDDSAAAGREVIPYTVPRATTRISPAIVSAAAAAREGLVGAAARATGIGPSCERTGPVPGGGGDFAIEYLYLYTVAHGRITRVKLFELDAALARFEELCAGRKT